MCYNLIEKSIKPIPLRFQYLFLTVTVFCGSFFLLTINYRTNVLEIYTSSEPPFWYSRHYNTSITERFAIKTEGCIIPAMNPLDDAVKQFVSYPKSLAPCPRANISLLQSNSTHIWINKSNAKNYNITGKTKVNCCYRGFYRQNAIDNIFSFRVDDRIRYGECAYFSEYITIKDEFVRVTCSVNNKSVYDQYYIQAPAKPIMYTQEINKNKSSYNVLILGIDNVSRLNFHRTMPKTLAYLKEKGAVDLVGYNKVGDNSFPNLIPLLMGYKDNEIQRICLPNKYSTFDECPFIWNLFKDAGYYTALAEDSAYLGTFNYGHNGFAKTPVDYYAYPFIKQAEQTVGCVHDFNSNLCMNDKRFFQVILDYMKDIITTLKTKRLFGFFWTVTMSHDYLNYPMVLDEPFLAVLKRLTESKYLDQTILFLVSDHGIRWGSIRSTKQGRLEERLPFVYVLTPQSFRENYSEAYNNLKLNSRRLATPFDVHETLADLVNLENINNENINARRNESYAGKRGISLFSQIPANRTCRTASIDDHWCTCHTGTKILKTSKVAVSAGEHVIRELNLLLREHTQCARLSIDEIVAATEMVAVRKDKGWNEYMVTVKVKPSGGLFEATLRFENKKWTLSGTVSRLNLYGDQSRCVHDPHLKLYCYCS